MKRCGIYLIACELGVYLGSSLRMGKRLSEHRQALRRGKHHCRRLQQAWNRLGESAFVFVQVVELPADEIVEAEQRYIDAARAAGVCLNERRTAVNSLGRNHGYRHDWKSQPWATETDSDIARRLGVSPWTASRHRPEGTPSPAKSREWHVTTGRLGFKAQTIEKLRESARKMQASTTPAQKREFARYARECAAAKRARRTTVNEVMST